MPKNSPSTPAHITQKNIIKNNCAVQNDLIDQLEEVVCRAHRQGLISDSVAGGIATDIDISRDLLNKWQWLTNPTKPANPHGATP